MTHIGVSEEELGHALGIAYALRTARYLSKYACIISLNGKFILKVIYFPGLR